MHKSSNNSVQWLAPAHKAPRPSITRVHAQSLVVCFSTRLQLFLKSAMDGLSSGSRCSRLITAILKCPKRLSRAGAVASSSHGSGSTPAILSITCMQSVLNLHDALTVARTQHLNLQDSEQLVRLENCSDKQYNSAALGFLYWVSFLQHCSVA